MTKVNRRLQKVFKNFKVRGSDLREQKGFRNSAVGGSDLSEQKVTEGFQELQSTGK